MLFRNGVKVGVKSTSAQGDDVSGNVQRAAAIFLEYGDFIRAVIRHKINDEGKVEDLFHNFFLSLVSRPVPEEVKDVKSYIYKAIINDIADHIRYLGRYHAMTHKCADYSKLTVNNRPPEDALIVKEQAALMIKLIRERVTKNEFKAIASRYSDDMSIKEAAEKMGINNRSISRYVSTGLRKVKRFLAVLQEAGNDST